MAKMITLVGTPSSGKAYFLAAMAIALEEKGLGRIDPLHYGFGFVMDSAFARAACPLSSTTTSYFGTIRYGKRKKIGLSERTFSRATFGSNPGLVAEAIAKSHCAVIFLESTTHTKPIGQPGQVDDEEALEGSRFSLNILSGSAKLVNLALLKEFKPWWKFRRKVKQLVFVTTNVDPSDVSSSEFGKQASVGMKQGLEYVTKRKVPYSFHSMDLLLPLGGIDFDAIEPFLSKILDI